MGLTLRPTGSGMIPGDLGATLMQGGVITIGRGDANDLTLPDPDRHISKHHCVIEQQGDAFFLSDKSVNGTFLNHASDRVGTEPVALNDGDVITIGRYEFQVEIAPDSGVFSGMDPMDDLPPPMEQTSISAAIADGRAKLDPNEALSDALEGDDDLLGILGTPPGGPGAQGQRPFLPDDPGLAPEDDLSKPFDNLAGPDRREVIGDPMAPAGVPGLDDDEDDWLAPPAPQADHVPDHRAHFTPPSAKPGEPPAPAPTGGMLLPEDWDSDGAGDAQDPFAAAMDRPSPDRATSPAPRPAPREPTPAAAPPNDVAAARRFLAAAGAEHLDIPDTELEETMARLGTAFRAMVIGLREVLMTRSQIKSEIGDIPTMIGATGNNPLKFSVSPEHAIEAMVRPTVPGYLPADEAAAQAMTDIKAHEVAMMAGIQAALRAMFVRLDPGALVGRLEREGGILDMISGKKARYWEVYEELYGQIAREAEDDFHKLFGKEFLRAYKEQLKKL